MYNNFCDDVSSKFVDSPKTQRSNYHESKTFGGLRWAGVLEKSKKA